MIKRLSISNYVLIDKLSIDFNEGFTSITGETGAGKSILLGALGLILGDRADTQSLANNTTKCIVEAEFQIKKYALQNFFKKNDLELRKSEALWRQMLTLPLHVDLNSADVEFVCKVISKSFRLELSVL